MLIAAWVLAAAHGVLSVAGLFAAVRRKNRTGENVVWLPFYVVAIVMVCGTILSIPTVVCAMDGDWMFALFGTIVLASICMMTAYLNCVIWYDDEGFVARNFFGIRRSCSYAEVDGVKGWKDRKIYFNGYCIMIDEISIGADEFMDALYKGYRKATGRHVPAFKPKWDPMNGHLEHPWGYFILWITLGLACIAFALLMLFVMTGETDPADVTVRSVQFSRYDVDDESLLLYVDGEERPYEIGYYKDYGEILPSPEAFCNGRPYTVGVEAGSHYIVTLTGADDFKYITLESERQVYRDNQRFALVIILLTSVLGVFFSYLGIAVARHPERYSKFVRRMFYKEGTLI